jgi:2-polyprenyl-3-methyl-5-hydroxy-6-metoxy-1,4-benzoquinol methylase
MWVMDSADQTQEFWDELCGTNFANSIGIGNDFSSEALSKFDHNYFNFYPYLIPFLEVSNLAGCEVLEVGIGYSSVTELLCRSGCSVTAVDIASEPIALAQLRFKRLKANGRFYKSDFLSCELPSATFDRIYAIGSLHHVGNLQEALRKCAIYLKSNGQIHFMVYNAYSWRRWRQNNLSTLKYLTRELRGYRGSIKGSALERKAYDSNSADAAPPHTEWISKKSLQEMLKEDFCDIQIVRKNWDMRNIRPTRDWFISHKISELLGLDLYCIAKKAQRD